MKYIQLVVYMCAVLAGRWHICICVCPKCLTAPVIRHRVCHGKIEPALPCNWMSALRLSRHKVGHTLFSLCAEHCWCPIFFWLTYTHWLQHQWPVTWNLPAAQCPSTELICSWFQQMFLLLGEEKQFTHHFVH